MTYDKPAGPDALFDIVLFAQQGWQTAWAIQIMFWNAALALVFPPRDRHPCAATDGQLVVPAPIAVEDEPGLFA